MYVLTRRAVGPQPNIEINVTRYAALKDALMVQRVALEIEQKFDLVMANYEEFEREILAVTLAYMVRPKLTWSSMSSARLLLNRRIANLLSTCRLYVDQVKLSVNKFSTHVGCTLAQAEEVFSEQYDKALGYEIMENLRNHVQHRSLGISGIFYSSKIEDGPGGALFSFTLSLELNIEALRDDNSFKQNTLHKLESLPSPQNDIIFFIRQYIEGLGHAQGRLRKLIEPAIDKADATIDAALMEWRTAGHNDTGLAAANLRDDSTEEEHIVVTDNLKKKRVELVTTHSSFANLSRRFVSSVRPRDAYPPFRQETGSDDKG